MDSLFPLTASTADGSGLAGGGGDGKGGDSGGADGKGGAGGTQTRRPLRSTHWQERQHPWQEGAATAEIRWMDRGEAGGGSGDGIWADAAAEMVVVVLHKRRHRFG